MLLSRRGVLAAGGLGGLTLIVGCSGADDDTDAGARASLLEWLAERDEVTSGESVPPPSEYDDEDIVLVHLLAGLPDAGIDGFLADLREHLTDADLEVVPTVHLEVDDFESRVSTYTSSYGSPDAEQDLERLKWLRADGRAVSSSYGPSGQFVVAPRAEVAAVALGFEAASPAEGRETNRVTSEEGDLGIEWGEAPTLGWSMPRERVERLAALQARYPGITGYLVTPDLRASVRFATTDLSLDELLADPLGIVGDLVAGTVPGDFEGTERPTLEVGWGPGRADAGRFARVFGDPGRRRLLEALVEVPGVTGLVSTFGDDLDEVVVRDRAGLLGALDLLAGDNLRIALQRETGPYLTGPYPTVLETTTYDDERVTGLYAAVADLPAVVFASSQPPLRLDGELEQQGFATLGLSREVTDDELRAALTPLLALPETWTRTVLAKADDSPVFSGYGLMEVTRRRVRSTAEEPAVRELAARVVATWRSLG